MGQETLEIGFVGGGNMAFAMVSGLIRTGHEARRIIVSDPAVAARERLRDLHAAIRVSDDNAAAAAAAVLVLAVKPQVFPAVLAGIAARRRPPGQLVLSVAAGVTLATLAGALGAATATVRVMPNQPALVGEGISVLVASPAVTQSQRASAQYVAESSGKALWLDDEGLMDAVTAVSGSGPAYFYLLMEVMEQTGVELGLPAATARALVRQTALGAARSALPPDAEAAALRATVTSPGGTTAAALAVMDAAGVRDTLRRAIVAARDRGAELGRGTR